MLCRRRALTGVTANMLDRQALSRWLAVSGIARGDIDEMRALVGGTQNLILRFSCGGQNLVLRRPPPDRAHSKKTVRRESIVLSALQGTDVPHPHFRGVCDDPEIAGGAFLVTDEVQGFNATVSMQGQAADDPAFRRKMGLALVDGLAALARLPLALGELSELGKAEGFLTRQVARWASQLEAYSEMTEWPGPAALGPVDAVGVWLQANLPADYRPGLMHGDYHIANVLFRADDGGLAAILDWELAAVGDPLLDLGRLTTVWPNAAGDGLLSLKVEPWTGFPSEGELIERYAAKTGRSMAALPWFQVLACYKFAIVLEGTHARACAGRAPAETGSRLHASAKGLIAKAADLISAQ